ncbi:hypothetical protein LTR86_011318, partial [Recurvomyces mirabilis]
MDYSQGSLENLTGQICRLTTDLNDCKITDLRELASGEFNRVFAARLVWPGKDKTPANEENGVIRIPRFPPPENQLGQNVCDLSAVLNFLSRHDVPVPVVRAFDTESDNAVGSPYMVLSLIPGSELGLVY